MDPANSQQAEQSEGIEEYVDFVRKPWLRKTKLEIPMLLNIIIFYVNLIFLIGVTSMIFFLNVNVSLMLFLTEIYLSKIFFP